MLKRYAVMGHPVAHSLSPTIHQLFAEPLGIQLSYDKITIELLHFEQQVNDFFQSGGKGLNITLPCKEHAFAMSDAPTARCSLAKAANTLWMNEGCLHADNTDGIGFLRDIEQRLSLQGLPILILGAGGATRGLLGPLFAANPATVQLANRSLPRAQALQADFPALDLVPWEKLKDIPPPGLIINATSAGLDVQALHLPPSLFTQQAFCYDLAYRQSEPTTFVQQAWDLACPAVDGLGMLVEQAAEAFYLWHGILPQTKPVLELLRKYR